MLYKHDNTTEAKQEVVRMKLRTLISSVHLSPPTRKLERVPEKVSFTQY